MSLLLVAFVDTLVMTLIVLRSRWRGWRLALATGFSLYGVMTFMAQIETAWFAPAMTTMRISPALIRGLFLQTLPLVLVWVPLAVTLLTWGWPTPAYTHPRRASLTGNGETSCDRLVLEYLAVVSP